jgi:acyl-CoA thioesterase-1
VSWLRRRLFARSYRQVEQYAAEWQAHNAQALEQDGPLWLVLGDSAAQAVGASSRATGYVGLVLERLRADRTPWRVVNLSRSGARIRDVVGVQLPAAADLQPDLVTAVVGGNDAVGTSLGQWLRDIDRLVAALPPKAVVATTPRGVFERKTRQANAHLLEVAAAHDLVVADLWSRTGPPYRGRYADGFHPNDKGYLPWADGIEQAVRRALEP